MNSQAWKSYMRYVSCPMILKKSLPLYSYSFEFVLWVKNLQSKTIGVKRSWIPNILKKSMRDEAASAKNLPTVI